MGKPYEFVVSERGFKMQLEVGSLTGYIDEKKDLFHRFTRAILVKKGDFFILKKGKPYLNGEQITKRTLPGRRRQVMIGWAAKKIRLAVFPEGKHWIAADTRSYNVSQGDNPIDAIRSLILTMRCERDEQKKMERKGKKVIRWHVERTPGAKAELLEMEKKAKGKGLLLAGVEWE